MSLCFPVHLMSDDCGMVICRCRYPSEKCKSWAHDLCRWVRRRRTHGESSDSDDTHGHDGSSDNSVLKQQAQKHVDTQLQSNGHFEVESKEPGYFQNKWWFTVNSSSNGLGCWSVYANLKTGQNRQKRRNRKIVASPPPDPCSLSHQLCRWGDLYSFSGAFGPFGEVFEDQPWTNIAIFLCDLVKVMSSYDNICHSLWVQDISMGI